MDTTTTILDEITRLKAENAMLAEIKALKAENARMKRNGYARAYNARKRQAYAESCTVGPNFHETLAKFGVREVAR